MAIPTVTNFDTDKIPVEGSPTFRADASYVWSTIPTVIDSMNSAIAEQNNVSDAVTLSETNAATSASNAANSEAAASSSATIAQSAANYKGDWVSAYNSGNGYAIADNVTYADGKNYVSKKNNNTVEPTLGAETAEWNFLDSVTSSDLDGKADKANPVFTGSITEQVGTMTTAIDATLGTIQTLTMTADTTLTDNLSDGQSVTLILSNGGYTVTYPTITWVGIDEPVLSATDVIVFFKASGTLYGSWNGATA